ncbi:MAG TPA: hypothetical protein PLO29_02555 [Paludibacter sp.]|jgi:hypothetical protein|nr:hypothetical protein [Paludibacter sp.]
MDENEKLDELIDSYLDASMSEEERVAFEARMANDPELRKEVDVQRSIIKAVRKERLEQIISNEEEKIKNKGKIRKLFIPVGSLALAASLLGLFYVGYMNSCENLASRYYAAYAYTPPPSRGGDDLALTKSDSLFFDALLQYENNNTKVAITRLKSLLDSDSEMLVATDLDIKWYLSLAYLKKGEKRKATALLQEIVNMPNNEYQGKAKDLLKEM